MSPPTTSSSRWWGTSQHRTRQPSSRTRPTTIAPATRARSESNSERRPSPISSHRLPWAWTTARCLKVRLASPASSSPVSRAPSRSWATPSSSKTPTTTVSALVEIGASVIARTFMAHTMLHMPKTVILGSARTPVGKMGGALASLDATELGGIAITAALERSNVAPEDVQHVVMGQVLQAGQGQIPSRQAQIKAGIPKEVSSETINKVCASGVRATVLLDQAIRAGDVEVGVGGGMESMSQAPYMLPNARFGYRMGDAK